MFSFFGTKKKKAFTLSTDLHSHLIPGIDDGAKDIEESLRLLKGLENLGYRKVITTPHIMSDCYRNNRDIIMNGLTYLRSEAKKEDIDVLIEAAAEYYLDDGFYAHLDEGNLLTLGNDYLLFETSYVAKPLQFEEMVFAISAAGYKPLLAHPERYRYIHNFEKEYRQMKELDIFFQVNINSFGGHYGKDAQKKAEFLSKHGMIDFLGSDIHHHKQVETLGVIHHSKKYQDIFKHNRILNYAL
jgi:tyrosine-protein phosphatase YwqE